MARAVFSMKSHQRMMADLVIAAEQMCERFNRAIEPLNQHLADIPAHRRRVP